MFHWDHLFIALYVSVALINPSKRSRRSDSAWLAGKLGGRPEEVGNPLRTLNIHFGCFRTAQLNI